MRFTCPCCGEQFPFEAGLADDDGKRLAALFAEFEPKLGRAVLVYLRLFSPARRSLRMTKSIRLVDELLGMVKTGSVMRDGRTGEARKATPGLWCAGIEQMTGNREKLILPLESHHYLRAVVWGLAGDAKAVAAASAASASRKQGPAPVPDYIERLARINGDETLGLIDAAEAARRRGELK
ncbi:MAG: hypothetical protein WC997_13575 [Porticoccaceae bacterium]